MTTKTTIEPTPAEVQAIQTAELKLRRANERLETTLTQIRRKHDDADIAGLRVAPDELEQLYEMQAADQELVERLEAELRSAIEAPALRVAKEKRGAELLGKAQTLDEKISAWAATGAALLAESDALADVIVREFSDPTMPILVPPFARSTIVQRLRFFAREIGSRGDSTTFAEKLAQFRALNEPPKPAVLPPAATGVYVRSQPVSRQAMQNSRMRSRLSDHGVLTETA